MAWTHSGCPLFGFLLFLNLMAGSVVFAMGWWLIEKSYFENAGMVTIKF